MSTSSGWKVSPYSAPVMGLNYRMPGPLLKDAEMTDCRNVHLDRFNCIKKREGYKTFGNNIPLAGSVMGVDQLYTSAGNNFLVAGTTSNFYYYNTQTKYWEDITPGTTLDTGEAAWTSNVAGDCVCSADATYKARGSKSAKMAIGAGAGTGLVAYMSFASVNISVRTQFHVNVRSSKATATGELWLGVSETTNMGGTPVYFELPALEANTWTICTATVDKDDAAIVFADLNAVLSVGLYVQTDIGAMDVYVDDFKANTMFTGDESNLWMMDIMSDKLIMTNYVNNIQTWDGSALVTSDLAGTPPKARALKKYKNYLLLIDVYGASHYPQRVQWCDTGDMENWTTGNAGSIDLMEGVDWNVGIDILNSKVVIFKERSIYTGYLVNTTEIFVFDEKIAGVGTPAGATVVNMGDEIIFMGWDNFYAFNGMTIEPIGDSIKDEFFNRMNPAAIYNCHAHIIEELDEIHFFIPAESADYPDEVFVFNYVHKCWTRDTRDNITRCGYYTVQATQTWDLLEGTWNDQGFKWDDRSLLDAAPSNLMGGADGMMYEWDYSKNSENAVAFDAYVDTKDFVMDVFDSHKYWMRLDIIASGNSIDVYYSIDEGKSWVVLELAHALTSDYITHKFDFRVSSERIRFRVQNNEVATFSFRQFTVYSTVGGRI